VTGSPLYCSPPLLTNRVSMSCIESAMVLS
jgi:hypothetical protein